jgi:cardiolipin synthase (CMP-forming)
MIKLSDGKVWTISNLISVLRGFLTIPMAFFIYYKMVDAVMLLGLLAYLSDLADGFLARRLNQISEYGKIFDPLADKIFVGVSALMLIITGLIPLWFGIAIFTRDILILTGGIFATRKLKRVMPSDYIGKGTVVFISAACILSVLNIEILNDTFHLIVRFLYWASTAMMAISLINYSVRMVKAVKG